MAERWWGYSVSKKVPLINLQNNIEALRSRLDLIDLARDYVRDIRRSGKNWTGLCPFHDEKTPSFHLNAEQGLYYCFGCKKGGDAIKLYMEIERVDFKEALELLSERVGLPKPVWSMKKSLSNADEKLRDEVRQALKLAGELYQAALWAREDSLAETAREYVLKKRSLSKALLEKLGAGLAPKGPSWLYSILVTKHGISPKAIEKAGLSVVSSRDGRYLDFFRNRIVFPVLDLQGRTVGFGGRVIPSSGPARSAASGSWGHSAAAEGPKYLNSPDTPFFKKGDTLYALAQHKDSIKEKDKSYLVEGYFDVAGLAEAGLPLAVSPMGGALTEQQARVLKRFSQQVTLIFDPDAAGISSAVSAGRILLAAGFQVRVLNLPNGLDPDEYVIQNGREAFEDLEIREAKSVVEFELEHLIAGRPLQGLTISQRQMICRQMLTTLSKFSGEIERRDAIRQVAQMLRVDAMGLERELWRQEQSASSSKMFARPSVAAGSSPAKISSQSLISLEESLLAIACSRPEDVRLALSRAQIGPDDFENKQVAAYIFEGRQPLDTQGRLEASWQDFLSRVCVSYDGAADTTDSAKSLTDLVAGLRRRSLKKEFDLLQQNIRTHRAQSKPMQPQMLSRLQELTTALKVVGSSVSV